MDSGKLTVLLIWTLVAACLFGVPTSPAANDAFLGRTAKHLVARGQTLMMRNDAIAGYQTTTSCFGPSTLISGY